jgi:DNA-binding Xre family transcriptional regulator
MISFFKGGRLRFIYQPQGLVLSPEEGMMITKRMIMSNELAAKIKDAKNILEEIAGSNKTTDATSEWLYNLCELLDEVC